MALDFPSSPSNGDTYNGYVYNSTVGAWQIIDTTAKIVNTDDDPGNTIYVGSVDPDGTYTLAAGDVWIEPVA